jgi:hypothetical protein
VSRDFSVELVNTLDPKRSSGVLQKSYYPPCR